MLRTDLLALVRLTAGPAWNFGDPLTVPQRTAIRSALRGRLNNAEGRQALQDAPRVRFTDKGVEKNRQMTIDDAVRAIMEELGRD